ncbi:transcriptional regulator, LacI family [Prauserella sp. Am3]|nr:transcriptional regulator, LacI family [Prauserella sp. Am3]
MAARGRATLRSVAERAGVDVSTVSRVLNGSPEEAQRAASTARAEHIRRVAAELNYRPNPHATSLRTQRSNLVGVLVPQLSDLVLATIYEGIEAAAAEHGLATFVMNSHDDPDQQRARTDLALSRHVDGLIFGDARADGDVLATVADREVPFVLVSRRVGDYPSVTCDDYAGGRLVAEHFLESGHNRVGVIAGEPFASTGSDRTAGFVDHCRERGLELPESHVVHSPFDVEGGRQAADRLLNLDPRPTAIFAVNDFAAIGAMGAVRDHGMTPGVDVAVAGFNDTPLARELPIPLTSVRSPMHEMGVGALELLVTLLNGQPGESRALAPKLQIRESSKG